MNIAASHYIITAFKIMLQLLIKHWTPRINIELVLKELRA